MESKQVDYKMKYKRAECDDLLKRKFFYTQSFQIYGGVAGLYDWGPLGAALKNNVEQLWRQHFIIEEDMLEISAVNLTPEQILKTSGHVDKFADFMVKDMKNGQCFRADKLIEETVEKIIAKKKGKLSEQEHEKLRLHAVKADGMSQEELQAVFVDLKIKSPDTGNDLSEPEEFNLMFKTQIGPVGNSVGFLRPETAQSIFVNFKKCLEYNNGKMPFAAAQIGLGFRNEISPRDGLLRVREFTMGEIEHFVDPQQKNHYKFNRIQNTKLPLLSAHNQLHEGGKVEKDTTIGEAVSSKLVDNETLGYFMTRSYLFFMRCGIHPDGIRYRQHLSTEMAHYACDCWDAEIETSYGWIEVAGHADRSAFDLTKHSEKTKVDLIASRQLKESIQERTVFVLPNKKELGKSLKRELKGVTDYLDNLTDEQKDAMLIEFNENGKVTFSVGDKEYSLDKTQIEIKEEIKTVMEEKYIPSVIEPSFGFGRVMYCIFEHCFKVRPEEEEEKKADKKTIRSYFQFPPKIAPIKTSILPLIDKPELHEVVQKLKLLLNEEGIPSKIDDTSVSIGRRYARTDECGIPFALTVDFESLENDSVTMRDLDSMMQIRVPIPQVAGLLQRLTLSTETWKQACEMFKVIEKGS